MAEPSLTLVIGDKNFSSWSLRSWLLMKQFDIPFREEMIRLRRPESRQAILRHSPGGTVPILKDGALAIWDTMAIALHLAERIPDKALWPADPAARGLARSIAAEMHSGFAALRTVCPMNLIAHMTGFVPVLAVKSDVERIDAMWQDARARFGARGPFLFGAFTIADAFYAPVCARFRTYAIKVSPTSQAYCEAVFALSAMQEWEAGARNEMAG